MKEKVSQSEILEEEGKEVLKIFGAFIFLIVFVYLLCKVIAMLQ